MSLGPLMMDLHGPTLTSQDRDLLRHPLVGGVMLFSRNYIDPPQLQALVADIHATRSPPLIVAVDQEGGRAQSLLQGFTVLPAARRIGHEFDLDSRAGTELARAMGWMMAAELRACGVDVSFAPCVDLDYGLSENIGDRSFHARPQVVGQLAVACMQGMRAAGMPATARHFPGYGAVVADPHHELPVDRRPFEDLTDDLAPYRRMIANNVPAILVAHVLLPDVDTAPVSLSARWLRGVLRGDLGFQGVVLSDDLSMGGAVAAHGDIVTRARQALSAGCDMLPVCNNRDGVVKLLAQLDVEPQPASSLRLVRLHGRQPREAGAGPRPGLASLPEWQRYRELLARCAAAPTLDLEAGSS